MMRERLVEQLAQVESVRDGLEEAQQRLESQAAELQRSNRDLEQFAYVASHDLQEPLRKVASFCQLLERRYAGQLDERADQYIAFAVDGAKRMQQLINDLLAFSRIGRRTSGRDEVPLDGCFAGALRNLETAIEETGASVHQRSPARGVGREGAADGAAPEPHQQRHEVPRRAAGVGAHHRARSRTTSTCSAARTTASGSSRSTPSGSS